MEAEADLKKAASCLLEDTPFRAAVQDMVQQVGDLLTQITYLNTNSGLVQFRPEEEVSQAASASSKSFSTVHQKPKP